MAETLGQRIRKARENYGMSQTELAKRVGISKTAMNQIERGETLDPHFSRVQKIADILRVSMDYFAGRGEEPAAPAPPTRPRSRTTAPVG
jgi:transcriptional regulator with XRE-family HTH domain